MSNPPYIGMPAALYLDEFGNHLWNYFNTPAYLVGSVLTNKQWRDVDIRLILADEVYEAMGFGHPDHTHCNVKWVAICMAFAELGRKITGLPIDFQIQQRTWANKHYQGERSCIGLVGSRYATSIE
jgi:hypothetical protein